MRFLLQAPTYADMSPEAAAGFILAFVIVGFYLMVLTAYTVYQTAQFKELKTRLTNLELHPKLHAKDVLEE